MSLLDTINQNSGINPNANKLDTTSGSWTIPTNTKNAKLQPIGLKPMGQKKEYEVIQDATA